MFHSHSRRCLHQQRELLLAPGEDIRLGLCRPSRVRHCRQHVHPCLRRRRGQEGEEDGQLGGRQEDHARGEDVDRAHLPPRPDLGLGLPHPGAHGGVRLRVCRPQRRLRHLCVCPQRPPERGGDARAQGGPRAGEEGEHGHRARRRQAQGRQELQQGRDEAQGGKEDAQGPRGRRHGRQHRHLVYVSRGAAARAPPGKGFNDDFSRRSDPP